MSSSRLSMGAEFLLNAGGDVDSLTRAGGYSPETEGCSSTSIRVAEICTLGSSHVDSVLVDDGG